MNVKISLLGHLWWVIYISLYLLSVPFIFFKMSFLSPLPCSFLSVYVRFCQFLLVSVHFCPFLPFYVRFPHFLFVLDCFFPFLSISVHFCPFLSASVSFCFFCPFLSVLFSFCPFLFVCGSFEIGANIWTHWEIHCLQYAGLLRNKTFLAPFQLDRSCRLSIEYTIYLIWNLYAYR